MELYKKWEKACENWLNEGSTAVQNVKTIGILATFAIATLVGSHAIQSEETKEINNTLHRLDQEAFVIIHSQKECQNLGYSSELCIKSEENALKVEEHFQQVAAQPKHICEATFGSCRNKHEKYNSGIYFYSPSVVAWQALESDIEKSAALYPSAQPNQYIRADGIRDQRIGTIINI